MKVVSLQAFGDWCTLTLFLFISLLVVAGKLRQKLAAWGLLALGAPMLIGAIAYLYLSGTSPADLHVYALESIILALATILASQRFRGRSYFETVRADLDRKVSKRHRLT
jgi:hypothetical protein